MFFKTICPEKVCRTRWLDHKMKAIKKLSDIFVVFPAHLENIISDTTLQGKYINLIQASFLLRSAFLSILQPTQELSLA